MADEDERHDRLILNDAIDVDALYPRLYFASVGSLTELTARQLVDAVLAVGRPPVPATQIGAAEWRGGAYPAAQFVVSTDPPDRFDSELSMREPFELQVWPDGTFAVEIEFVGADVRADPRAGDAVSAVLSEWAGARGWKLAGLYNDRGRSLPDVWNARFVRDSAALAVADAVEFARRAARVAETHRYNGESVDQLVTMVRAGDVEGLAGTPVTAVFQPRPGLDVTAGSPWHAVVLDVCAFANAVHGGLLVLGLAEHHGRVAGVTPFVVGDSAERIVEAIARCVFPPPDGLVVDAVAVGGGRGVVFVIVPPQDRVLKPFLVHGGIIDGSHHQQGVTLVERRDATIYSAGIAALHAQIAAGGALLRGDRADPRQF
ncbi:hypothetical protein [Dactylosporangium sp. CA-233914]|uniref:hypothetical protein n=1 Tax=Dactylosporangium sp. CA-233914 TaxID=3239934 RepID=UPI003D8A23A4